MNIESENIRMHLTEAINGQEAEKETFEKQYGQVWDTDQLRQDFEVNSFLAPYVFVTRKSDKKRGYLMFQHSPRFYFSFQME
jgi:hypothetical protein